MEKVGYNPPPVERVKKPKPTVLPQKAELNCKGCVLRAQCSLKYYIKYGMPGMVHCGLMF